MLLKCSKQVKATLLELPFVVAAPYLVGWLLLAAALWWVGRARRWQEEGLTTEKIKLGRVGDLEALQLFLDSRGVTHTELTEVAGATIAKYGWEEPAARKWRGKPPAVELVANLSSGFVLGVNVCHAPRQSALRHDKARELVLRGLWACSPPVFHAGEAADEARPPLWP